MLQISPGQLSQASLIAALSPTERRIWNMGLTPQEREYIMYSWAFWGRPAQLEPPGMWSVWLALAGRGFGKTRLGAEWVKKQMCGSTPLSGGKYGHIALIAETAADARDVMVESESGILRIHHPDMRPAYTKSLRKLEWPNGAVAHTYSADDPEQLRGPQHDAAWSDELAKWRYADETWDMLQFGLRTGDDPRQLVTTTPRPIPIIRELLEGEESGETVVTRGNTYDNAEHLSPKFIRKIEEKYEDTRLGRQEIHAEVLDDVPGAMWTRTMLSVRTQQNPLGAIMRRNERLPDMQRIVIGVDPSGSSGEIDIRRKTSKGKEDEAGDDIGIVVAGMGVDGIGYVLDDATVNLGPAGWGMRVVEMYDKFGADRVVGEMNYGGAMVEYTIKSVDKRVRFRPVHASRGKAVRAEPIAALYEQGRVRHVGSFGPLEDQMVNMTQRGYEGRGSPDRLDAAVWALTDLFFGRSSDGGAVSVQGHY